MQQCLLQNDGVFSLTCSLSWTFLVEASSPERKHRAGCRGVTLRHAGDHGAGRGEKAQPRGSDSWGPNPPEEPSEADL